MREIALRTATGLPVTIGIASFFYIGAHQHHWWAGAGLCLLGWIWTIGAIEGLERVRGY